MEDFERFVLVNLTKTEAIYEDESLYFHIIKTSDRQWTVLVSAPNVSRSVRDVKLSYSTIYADTIDDAVSNAIQLCKEEVLQLYNSLENIQYKRLLKTNF